MGRDRNRTPMQWSDAVNGGFSPAGVEPWLPVNPDYRDGVSVSAQDDQNTSLLCFYRLALKLRKEHAALQTGEFAGIECDNTNVLVFKRWNESSELLVVLNLNPEAQRVELPSPAGRYIFGNLTTDQTSNTTHVHLLPYQGMVFSQR